jgi:hypothetical protein
MAAHRVHLLLEAHKEDGMKQFTKSIYGFKAPLDALIRLMDQFVKDVYDDFRQSLPSEVSSLPTASKENRGRILIVPNGSSIDEFFICRKNGSSYEWKRILTQLDNYTPSNVTEDRTYDADSTTTAELADIVGTIIEDLD